MGIAEETSQLDAIITYKCIEIQHVSIYNSQALKVTNSLVNPTYFPCPSNMLPSLELRMFPAKSSLSISLPTSSGRPVFSFAPMLYNYSSCLICELKSHKQQIIILASLVTMSVSASSLVSRISTSLLSPVSSSSIVPPPFLRLL
jgi:hypothetical protein